MSGKSTLVAVCLAALMVTGVIAPGAMAGPNEDPTAGWQREYQQGGPSEYVVQSVDDGAPLEQKFAALSILESVEADGGAEKRLDRTAEDLNGTLDHYRGVTYVESESAFRSDRQAVSRMKTLRHDAPPNKLNHSSLLVVRADERTANATITAAEAALDTVEDDVENSDQLQRTRRHLDKARAELERGREVGDRQGDIETVLEARAKAIRHYGTAWKHARAAIETLDEETTPVLEFTRRADRPVNGSEEYRLRGRVFAVQPYELSNVTVSVNGSDRSVPLRSPPDPASNATFDANVTVESGPTVITAAVENGSDGSDGHPRERASKGNGQSPHASTGDGDDGPPSPLDAPADRDVLLLDGDVLPDIYELTTTETDPLARDSDSDRTDVDEVNDGVVDGAHDFDDDGMVTYQEYVVGTDPFDPDTDGDGLPDEYETATSLDATEVNSEDDGTPDSERDRDGDGLTEIEEFRAETNPLESDTDGDELSDGRELELGSDPLEPDTDGDELSDGWELEMGTDPLRPDTDGDGVPDGNETFTTTATANETDVTVAATGDGAVADGVSIDVDSSNGTQSFAASPSVRVQNETAFDSATVTIPVDRSIDESDADELAVYKWQPGSGNWTRVETDVDPVNDTASATVESFSFFSVFWIEEWNDRMTDETVLDRNASGGEVKPIDLMFVIDESGSMSGTRLRNAKSASKRFVGALYADDRAGLTGYSWGSSLKQELTADHKAVNRSIDSLSAGGSTNTGAGIRTGRNELVDNGVEDHDQVMILLSDGYTNRGPNPIAEAAEAAEQNVTIHTIGVGSNIDEQELRRIAGETGGDFYHVRDSSDLPETFDRIAEAEIELVDGDDDSIPDVVEEMDLRIPAGPSNLRGEPIDLDPERADTDGDMIPDGEEVAVNWVVEDRNGTVTVTAAVTSVLSHPSETDTDDDGLADFDEAQIGTSPLLDDTDGDGLVDGEDSDPMAPVQRTSTTDLLTTPGDSLWLTALAGLSLGELGLPDGLAETDLARSPVYLVGWLLSIFLPTPLSIAAEIRDAFQSALNRDALGVIISLLGIVLGVTKVAKGYKAVAKFRKAFPHLNRVKRVIDRFLLKHLPEEGLRYHYEGLGMSETFVRLSNKGFSPQDIRAINQGLPRGVKLQDVADGFKTSTRSGSRLYVFARDVSYGFEKVRADHVLPSRNNLLVTYPMAPDEIASISKTALRNGQVTKEGVLQKVAYRASDPQYREHVIVTANGGQDAVSAGNQVYTWYTSYPVPANGTAG